MKVFKKIILVYFGHMLEPIVEFWQFYFYFFQNLMNYGFFVTAKQTLEHVNSLILEITRGRAFFCDPKKKLWHVNSFNVGKN